MERLYYKLVRDRISEIIQGDGNEPVTYVLDDVEFKGCLFEKLHEL